MSAIKIISMPIKILGSVFVLIFVLFFGVYFSLLNGIKLDHLSFSNLEISQLYLKLDKKFYLSIDSIEDKSLDDGTFDININEDSVNLAQKIVDEFHFIDIKKIKTKDFDGSLRLDKNSILVFSNIFDLNTSYGFDGPNYYFDVHKFYFKSKNVQVVGKIQSNIKTKNLSGNLNVKFHQLNANLNFKKQNNLIALNAATNKLSNLEMLKYFMNMDKSLKEWLFVRLQADDFAAKISCIYDLDKNNVDPQTLKVAGVANNAKIKFHDELDEVATKNTYVTIGNSSLSLKFDKPTFAAKNLSNSSVLIENLFDKPKMHINIKNNGPFDSQIIKLLSVYDINVSDIYQTKGNSDTSVDLFFDLYNDSKVVAKATSLIKNAQFNIYGKIVDISNSQFIYDKNVFLKNTDFTFENAKVKMADFVYDLNSQKINFVANVNTEKYKNIKIEAIADVLTKELKGEIVLPKIDFGELLLVDEKKVDFLANLNDGFNAFVKEYNLQILNKSGKTELNFLTLKPIAKYSKYAQKFKIDEGTLKISTNDFENFDFDALVREPDVPFELSYRNRTIDKFNIFGQYKNGVLSLSDKFGLIKFVKDDEMRLDLKNLTITQIDEVDYRKKIKEVKKERSIYEVLSEDLNLPKMKISAINCKFKNFIDTKIDFDIVNIVMDKSNIAIDGDFGASKLNFKKYGEGIYLAGIKVSDKLLNIAMGTSKLSNGYVSFKLSGDSKKLDGFVDMYDMDLIGIPIVSNIKKGSAKVSFDTTKEIVNFDAIKTKGDVVDLEGVCAINLKDKSVKAELDIIFARNISTAISYLPIIGYIIFGDDPRIKMQASVSGAIANPKVETHFVKGTTMGVASILERVLMLPIDVVGGVGKVIIGDK